MTAGHAWRRGESVRFEGVVEPMPWGRAVYVVLAVPEELARAARAADTHRVEGALEGTTGPLAVNVGLARADVRPETFLYVGKQLQRRLGVAPGDVVEADLAPVDPLRVLVPEDVLEALEVAGRRSAWERLEPPERRRRLMPVDSAARPATRAARIAALVAALPS